MNNRTKLVFTLTALFCALPGCVTYTEALALGKETPETAANEASEAQEQAGRGAPYVYLKAAQPVAGADFGQAVRLSGDGNTLVVSAPEANAAAGEVYVMRRVQNAWVQEAVLKAGNGEAGDHFGDAIAVSADGNTVVVGAPNESSSGGLSYPAPSDNRAWASGAAYVYARVGATWAQLTYLKPAVPQERERFGTAVAISPNGLSLAVSAPCRNADKWHVSCSDRPKNVGVVDVLHRSTTSSPQWESWGHSAEFLLSAGVAERNDMLSFSADGRVLAVAESSSNRRELSFTKDGYTKSCLHRGRVSLYELDKAYSDNIPLMGFASPRDTDACGEFGAAISLSGDGRKLAVLETSPETRSKAGGRLHTFRRPDTRWAEDATLEVPVDATAPDRSYSAMTMSQDGTTLAIGDLRWTHNLGGNVLSYTHGGAGWVQGRNFHLSAPEQDDYFGLSLSLSNDGKSLAIGAPGEDGAIGGIDGDERNDKAENSGAAYVWKL